MVASGRGHLLLWFGADCASSGSSAWFSPFRSLSPFLSPPETEASPLARPCPEHGLLLLLLSLHQTAAVPCGRVASRRSCSAASHNWTLHREPTPLRQRRRRCKPAGKD
ncbi:hypothetical protein SEVIR_2G377801v4 [Setaria viridis]